MAKRDADRVRSITARSSESASDPADSEPATSERMQELFLPIHGHLELYSKEVAVIDHPVFQRLRRVKQLGLAHMVFPSATHTRFEHSIGAVHVAQLIIDHVNQNHKRRETTRGNWKTVEINDATARLIRLGALLHDVGHLPLGHTLEDELNHLHSHDGPERLDRVARIPYPSHEVDYSLLLPSEKPADGWTLKTLVNRLYADQANQLGLKDVDAFTILSHIVCKPPKDLDITAWQEQAQSINRRLWLEMCRDIVGNTICADFLDYLYRDWFHIGKPLYFDKRLFQYMEVRQPANEGRKPQFVINVGEPDKVRHDALTDILELLNARYKLAETVLFHRTKLALTGLLDRCLLEIADLYKAIGLQVEDFKSKAETLLLNSSDEGLPQVLETLVADAGEHGEKLRATVADEKEAIERIVSSQRPLIAPEAGVHGTLGARRELIQELIDKLRGREVYTLAYKLRMADFTAQHSPDNLRLRELLDIYKAPQKRLEYLRMMEALCEFPRGSIVMNCPPDASMNAKIAKVNLFHDDTISPFDTYEQTLREASLTRGALGAQIGRFHELWAASVYIDARVWGRFEEEERKHLKSVLEEFFFQMDTRKDLKVSRAQIQPSLEVLRRKASRAGAVDPAADEYKTASFPSGMPFARSAGQ
jgi:HD superfamily phosphohydrolase